MAFRYVIVNSLLLLIAGFCCGHVAAQSSAAVSGTVIDKATGLALSGARVAALQTKAATVTDMAGHFRLPVAPGQYVLEVTLSGYQTTDSPSIAVGSGEYSGVTLAIQRSEGSTAALRTIASTTSRATQSLQSASITYSNLSPGALQSQGYFGLAEPLQNLPGVDNGGFATAAKGSHQELSIRGIGVLETVPLIDGHEAHAFQGAYDFSDAPTFGLRNVQVIYGSGTSGLYSVDAIGGVIDMQTLNPTLTPSVFFSQSYGTYNELATTFQATGTLPAGLLQFKGRFGYAIALGVDGDAGQYRSSVVYSPFAAFDASAPPGSPAHDIGIVPLGTGYLSRGSLFKLQYGINNNSKITGDVLTSVASSDQSGTFPIYTTHKSALALGNQNLAFKLPTDPCPAGTFTATNFIGYPNGFDQNGNPDGGLTCQTPAQYAAFNEGYQLFGPASQTIRDTDYNLRFDSSTERNTVAADVYTNTFYQFVGSPGLAWIPQATAVTQNLSGAESGIELSEDHSFRNHDLGVGYSYRNSVELFNSAGSYVFYGGSSGKEFAYFLRDVYHPAASPLTVYLYDWIKRSSLTETTYNDPRVALVYQRPNDVVRAAFGQVATQPTTESANSPFVPYTIPQFTATLACGVPNLIGAAPGNLKPERGTDEELSYGHRFAGDSLIQVSLYNEIVREKFFFTTQTLAASGTAGLPASLLQQFQNAYTAKCGPTPDVNDFLSMYGDFNIGRVQASGIDIQGRQRLGKTVSLDYGYDTQSSKLLDATPTFLQGDLTIIPGSQLPGVPLHTASLGVNFDLPSGLHAAILGHYVSVNNPRFSPAYTIYNADVGIPVGVGQLSFAVQNLFNLDGSDIIQTCTGVPLPLNSYASAADYTPCLGPTSNGALGAGWLAGLGGRRLIVTFSRRFP